MLKSKVAKFEEPDKFRKIDLYPFFRVIESEQDTVVKINGQDVLMFGSNSYLGLNNHPKLIEASNKACEKYGTSCSGSRFLNGTLDLHIELERRLAEFVGKESALVFSTGFQANLGAISSLLGRNDNLIIDELDHASIYDGCRLSFAKIAKFKHNNMQSLEKVLQKLPTDCIKLIIVDGLYSMEGDVANIPEITRLAEKYQANIMVDEAHSLGVCGEKGKGIVNYYNALDKVDLVMGTFSKSFASIGGFIAADHKTIDYLKHHARSLIFSASLPPSTVATVLAALDLIEEEPERINKLWENTAYAMKLLSKTGLEIGNSNTPIIPIYIRNDKKTFTITKELLDDGVFVNPVVPPAVPSNDTLIRFSLMATHSFEQIEEAIEKIERVVKKYNS